MMKKQIFRLVLLSGCVMFASLSLPSCEDGKEPNPATSTAAEPIGTYSFGGEPHDIFYAQNFSNEDTLLLRFSPLDGTTPLTTYFIVGIARELSGIQKDVTYLYHNDDYYFVYEDPVRFYSNYRSLRSGTIYVKETGENHFTVRLSAELPDETPFEVSFTGEIPRYESPAE